MDNFLGIWAAAEIKGDQLEVQECILTCSECRQTHECTGIFFDYSWIELLAGTVPANKHLLAGTPKKLKFQKFPHPLKVPLSAAPKVPEF